MNAITHPRSLARSRSKHRPSLRRRLLLLLLIPMFVALILDAVLTYSVALAYANHVHDVGLANDAITLAQMLKHESSQATISPQARFLIQYDPDGREYFTIRSASHGFVAGTRRLPPGTVDVAIGQSPALYSTQLDHAPLRAATLTIANPRQANDSLRITVAEPLNARHQQARQILLLAVPLQILLIIVLLLLVWFGVRFGLRVLDPLTRQLARRQHDLAPINAADVPVELLPLAGTINDLLARLRELMALHERFIADAAHQLRTPLTGLRLNVERALAHPDKDNVADALTSIRQLTTRTSRTANQLLTLTRAQSSTSTEESLQPLDLTALLHATIEARLRDAWRVGIDLGYEGSSAPVRIVGDGASLQDLIDNLIDNALHYAGQDGTVTVALHLDTTAGACLSVEDSGPGVDEALLPRLGERFFQAPNASGSGTGLGLAIVCRIAERHAARVAFRRASIGGLRVEVHFPLTGPSA